MFKLKLVSNTYLKSRSNKDDTPTVSSVFISLISARARVLERAEGLQTGDTMLGVIIASRGALESMVPENAALRAILLSIKIILS